MFGCRLAVGAPGLHNCQRCLLAPGLHNCQRCLLRCMECWLLCTAQLKEPSGSLFSNCLCGLAQRSACPLLCHPTLHADDHKKVVLVKKEEKKGEGSAIKAELGLGA